MLHMMRVGLRQLRSIVAVHSIGVHPDDAWTVNGAEWLPSRMSTLVTSKSRVLRYGYDSTWFGSNATRVTVSNVSQRLLLSLRRTRKVCFSFVMETR